MSVELLVRAKAGDQEAFRELVQPYRAELHMHCYRILGSIQDAEDALQEALLAAWRGLGSYEERASVRTWLYSIATNRALNMLRAARRRPSTSRCWRGIYRRRSTSSPTSRRIRRSPRRRSRANESASSTR